MKSGTLIENYKNSLLFTKEGLGCGKITDEQKAIIEKFKKEQRHIL